MDVRPGARLDPSPGQMWQDDPQPSDLVKRLGALSPIQLSLLEHRLRERKIEELPRDPILPHGPAEDTFRLSFAQERLWFLDQLQPGSPLYNLLDVVQLPGQVNASLLTRCLDEVVRRHEILRTVFRVVDGKPSQVVAPRLRLKLDVRELRRLPPERRMAEASRIVAREAQTPFDLGRGPLLRAVLLRLGETDQLVLTLHHIVADGWSINVIFRELAALYEAFSAGRPSPLPELPVQYADFAVWQRKWLDRAVLRSQLGYWRRQLAGAPAVLDLPADRQRPAVQSFHGATFSFDLGPVERELEELAHREEATLFMVLLAAFQGLLGRYTGQEDIVVGSPVANRSRAELEGLIGLFVNSLVLRTDLSRDPDFRVLLGRVRETMLGAFAHQELPFERLVEELQPERNLSHHPLFQVVFTLQSQPSSPARFGREPEAAGDAAAEAASAISTGTAKFDLTMAVSQAGGRLAGGIEYSTDIFDQARIARLAGHFRILLAGISAAPDRPLSELPLLSVAERHQIVHELNDTRVAYDGDLCLHELIEAQAKRTPQAPAVRFGDDALSFEELCRQADGLAHRLRRLGVGPDFLVGICLERSFDLMVAVLGVLKAGGAYVPFDPAYPRERLAYMLQQSGVRILVTRGQTAACLEPHDAQVVRLDEPDATPSPVRIEVSLPRVTPDNLAYVMYTSGSTGRPKGVQIAHRGLVNYSATFIRLAFVKPDSRFVQFASVSFDAWIFEVISALPAGAAIHLAPRESLLPGPPLEELIVEEGLTHAILPPSCLASLETLPSYFTVTLGGEAVPADQMERWGAQLRLINAYGPTETTIAATAALPGSPTPSIGRPLDNTRVYLLDRNFALAPIGVPAELYVGGDGVSRGYLGRPDLTAERFIPDPLSQRPGERLYRTGDLARYLPEGSIDFLGRLDHQVKIRGCRVELGEIETVLIRHEQVREAVVVVRDDRPGPPYLAAYAVPRKGAAPSAEELRSHLRALLPEYMVPSAFVVLDALPLTPNGKVDRRALPAPDREILSESGGSALPTNRIEEGLAAIWAEILGLSRVGVHDSFFDLGGHSLLAARLISRVREAFGIELPLRLLFEAPTVAGLAREIETTGLEAAGDGPAALPIVAVPRLGPLPLSFAQERLWFLDQLQPGSPAYNIPAAFRLPGALSPAALERSLGEIVRRHEILRTTFHRVDGRPMQTAKPRLDLKLAVHDLRRHPPEVRESEARRLALEEARGAFDLGRGPLLRASLLRLDDGEHLLLLNLHHIVADGWSMSVLFRELVALYEAFANGRRSPLPDLPVQYADFAVWQRQWLKGPVLETQLAYWRQQLAGVPAMLTLSTDRPRPAVQSMRGATVFFSLGPELTRSLGELARRGNATLFMVLLAALQALLHRYTGQEDLTVGSPIANRTRPELENLIGLFINTLVLRGDLSGAPGFSELLARTRERTLSAYAHQDLPFEKLVEELQPERSLSHQALFQVLLLLQTDPLSGSVAPAQEGSDSPPSESAGLGIEVVTRTAKFDLTLALGETPHGLAGCVEYATDLFDGARIARLTEHLRNLLAGIVADPQLPLRELQILSAAECQQLREWNDTGAYYPGGPLVHHLFEAQARRTPDAVAVSFEGRRLTYEELDRQADRVARRLRQLGVGPESRVGLAVERSLEMMPAVLGILKAGGAYVPLDPGYPGERLAFMLADSGAPVLLTQERLLSILPRSEARIVLVEEVLASEPVPDAVHGGALPQGAVYVIYTSGSTGRPKGVVNTHLGVVNRLLWMQASYGLGPEDRVLQKTPLSFDVSVWELFWPLATGSCLVVARPGGHQDSAYLVRTIAEEQVTTLHFVPSMLQAFVAEPGVEGLTSLRRVMASGEALPYELQERFFSHQGAGSGAELHNLYGPTEAAVDVTAWRCEPGSALRTVPIGRPIGNLRIHLLDRDFRPVPAGVAGELYIGGVGLARCYHGRPDLTAERFVPDPLGEEEGGRLYRTGDLARHLPDGGIDYLGRLDHQVKIRGFRIELGEVEAALLEHPGVRESVALVREDTPGLKRLVAYVVPREGATPTAAELRAAVRSRLPEPMVPAFVVLLDALPLTPSGKVDRRALPEPDLGRAAREKKLASPRRPAEEMLIEIWKDVLGVDLIGIHDSFFDLGGHSLLGTQVVSRVREVWGVELALREIFEAPTVAGLAVRIEAEGTGREGMALPPLGPAARQGPIPLSFSQERIWFLEQLQPGSVLYNIPASLRLPGRLSRTALERSLNEIVKRHEILRTTFRLTDGRPAQIVAPALKVPLTLRDLRRFPPSRREAEANRLAAEDARRPFDLGQGPLLRVQLVRMGDTDHLLIMTIHHIVTDGWSMSLLFQELWLLYEGFAAGRPSRLQDLPLQYADFAIWQRGWLRGSSLSAQLGYWREQLAGAPTVLELPTDRPRPPVQSFRGAMRSFLLKPALASALEELSRKEGATLFMTVLAAFAALLGRYSGQEDLTIGSPIANRTRAELESLIGLFVNTLVLRQDLSGNPGFRTLLARVREVTLSAYSHQDLPFEKLVESLQPERNLGYNTLFQVMLVLQNDPLSTRYKVPGPAEEFWFQGTTNTAKFDLTLFLGSTMGGMAGTVEYNTDLFDTARIARFIGHLETMLTGIAADPDRLLSELPLLSEAERQQLREWNGTAWPVADLCLHNLFEAQARRTPDAPALLFAGRTLSYRELDRAASRWARRLRRLGVGPDARVGIFAERSLEMMVGILAVLKAGGACVPLDIAYPRERLAFMLANAGVTAVLTQEKWRSALSAPGVPVLCLDRPLSGARGSSSPRPAEGLGPTPDSLAYVLYTSGSTGQPKGVAMAHRPLVNLVAWQVGASELPAGRTLQFSSPSFDVSFQEIFSTWSAGGTLVLVDEETRRDGERLLEYLAAVSAERLFLPYVALQQLALAAGGAEVLPSTLREVITAGETLQITPSVADLFTRLDAAVLHNQYGPTESHCVTSFRLAGPSRDWPPTPSIGRPFFNAQIHILDAALQPSPVGVPGEIAIGGEVLARGYLGRPDLTAERFVPAPRSGIPGARLYRTGDLGRFQPDGTIEFLGRRDYQVKVRGFRVELAEIEVVLGQHPSVLQAVVTAREGAQGARHLVAYVTLRGDADPTAAELAEFLRDRLPEYMVPGLFVKLPALPLTSSGKIDRRSLPAPSMQLLAPESADDRQQALSPLETSIAEIWTEILGVAGIHSGDDFFVLGGHSLLATQVISRIRDLFWIELPMRCLFEAPTVAGLALVIVQNHLESLDPAAAERLIEEVQQLPDERALALLTAAGPA